MDRLVIVGGGFAGVWSAASAALVRQNQGLEPSGLSIMVIDPQEAMVIRPRLYESRPADMAVALRRILRPIDVEHLQAEVRQIDYAGRRVTARDGQGHVHSVAFDRLVLAAGSALKLPSFPGAEYLHNVDSITAASRLEEHLLALPSRAIDEGRYTVLVVGAGFTGIEVATEMVRRLGEVADSRQRAQVRVILIERADVVGPDLGAGPRPVIEDALLELGIERRHGTTITSIDERAAVLSDGTRIAAATVIWTAGMSASRLTGLIPGQRDGLGRLRVDSTLRVDGADRAFAAGDTAAAAVEDGHTSMQSCQHAHAMGRIAGRNAAADLLGLEMVDFAPDPYVTCLDLGGGGAVFTSGWDRAVKLTGRPAKDLKRKINTAIYPPVDDSARILQAADHRRQTRTPTAPGGRVSV